MLLQDVIPCNISGILGMLHQNLHCGHCLGVARVSHFLGRGCHRITGTLVGLNALLELESLVMMYVHVDVCSGAISANSITVRNIFKFFSNEMCSGWF